MRYFDAYHRFTGRLAFPIVLGALTEEQFDKVWCAHYYHRYARRKYLSYVTFFESECQMREWTAKSEHILKEVKPFSFLKGVEL